MTALKQSGWVFLDDVTTTADMMSVARALGQPVSSPTGEMVKALSPVQSHLAREGSFSASFGCGEFPLHTDTAFWACPSRYLVLRVAGDGRRPTWLLHFEQVWGALGTRARIDAQRSVWRTIPQSGGLYCSMRFSDGAQRGWRFDPKVMTAANPSAMRALEDTRQAVHESVQKVAISWESTSCVVVDNWQVLHARGAGPKDEKQRVLYRIYVR